MIFLTRRKLNDIITKSINEKLEQHEWIKLLQSIEVGDFVKWDGLEWEVIFLHSCDFFAEQYLTLRIGEFKKTVEFRYSNPRRLEIVYEEVE